jgi:hypothetical protein
MNSGEIVALLISVVSLMSTIIGGAMAWQKIKDRSDENKRRIDELESRSECHDQLKVRLEVLANDIKWIGDELKRKRNGDSHHG